MHSLRSDIPQMIDSKLIIDALDRRYGQGAIGTKGEQWITIQEARSGAGFDGNNGQCDYLAINTWQSKGLQLLGHEIKVSMSDWKRELERPEKSERFARFCRRWWVVMPSELAKKVKPEIPPTWGLMSVSDAGRITEMVSAPSKEPDPVATWWWIGWLAQLDRRDKRRSQSEIDRLVNEAVTKAEERWNRYRPDREERIKERYATVDERLAELKSATGIDLHHTGSWQMDRLAALWKASEKVDVVRLSQTLRHAADTLSGLNHDREDHDSH
jgi:hypothetical protein